MPFHKVVYFCPAAANFHFTLLESAEETYLILFGLVEYPSALCCPQPIV